MPKPWITRDIHSNHKLLQLPGPPAITWKIYFPGQQTIFMISTFRQACVLAAKFGKRKAA